jgi:polyhydroxyalkanoate synthesis regulator phasin
MLKGFTKGILAGIDLSIRAAEGAEDLAMRFMREARVSETEARGLAREIMAQATEFRGEMERRVGYGMKRAFDTVGIAKKSDLDAANLRIEALEKAGQRASDKN